jgi:hypothetical protein
MESSPAILKGGIAMRVQLNSLRSRLAVAALLAVALPVPAASASQWGPYLEVTAFPSYAQNNKEGVSEFGGSFGSDPINATSGFSYDLRNTLGVKPTEWLLIGGTLNYASSPSHRDGTDTTPIYDRSLKTLEYGPSLGLLYGNLRLIGTYFVGGSMKQHETSTGGGGTDTDITLENKGAKGLQILLGYSFPVTQSFRVGPTLVYRHVTYDKQTRVDPTDPTNTNNPDANYADRSFTTKAVSGSILPMISLILSF